MTDMAMGPDLEMEGRSEAIMEALANKDNDYMVKELEDKHMECASNYEDNTFEIGASFGEQNEEAHESEDVELNIVDCNNSHDDCLVQSLSPNVTENSSSFGDTMSEVEIGDNRSDAEVVSEFHGDAASALGFGGSGELFRMRKKRLTSHWKTFIQPLMWRSKWAELQIKKFRSQAFKYDKILAENNRRKKLKVESFAPEGLGAKSLPFASDSQREKLMKRKKRKRAEDLIDTAAYMSNHNLFSYFGSRRSITDAASIGGDWAHLANSTDAKTDGDEEVRATNGLLSLDFRDDPKSLEQLLWKIGVVQLRVSELKTRLNKVTSENAGKFSSSTDKLSLVAPYNNALTGSILNPASPPNNGDRMGVVGCPSIASQLVHEYNNMGDLVMPESAASSHAEVTHFPDIIESTDQPRVGGSWRSTEDGFLIHNTRANEELNDFTEAKIHPIDKKLRTPKEEQGAIFPSGLDLEVLDMDDQPSPKIRSISKITAPKNKKKRAKRKAGSNKWSRRSSG